MEAQAQTGGERVNRETQKCRPTHDGVIAWPEEDQVEDEQEQEPRQYPGPKPEPVWGLMREFGQEVQEDDAEEKPRSQTQEDVQEAMRAPP